MNFKKTFKKEVNYVVNDIKTMTRDKAVNYLLGLGVALGLNSGGEWGLRWSIVNTALNPKAQPYAVWEIVLAKIIIFIGAAFIGWYAQVGVNLLQGQNHQLGVLDTAEQKRSVYGGIIGTVLCSTLFLCTFSNYLPFVIFGGSIVVFAVLLWGVPPLIAKIKKVLQKLRGKK